MLHPSRPLAIGLALIACAALTLGLVTDVGLFGWTFALLLTLYLVAVGIAHAARR